MREGTNIELPKTAGCRQSPGRLAANPKAPLREQFQVGVAHVQKDNVAAAGIRQRIFPEARSCTQR